MEVHEVDMVIVMGKNPTRLVWPSRIGEIRTFSGALKSRSLADQPLEEGAVQRNTYF